MLVLFFRLNCVWLCFSQQTLLTLLRRVLASSSPMPAERAKALDQSPGVAHQRQSNLRSVHFQDQQETETNTARSVLRGACLAQNGISRYCEGIITCEGLACLFADLAQRLFKYIVSTGAWRTLRGIWKQSTTTTSRGSSLQQSADRRYFLGGSHAQLRGRRVQ